MTAIDDIALCAAEYSRAAEPASRTTVRARLLTLLEELALRPGPGMTARPLTREEIEIPRLRGAVDAHLDLMFRTSVSSSELSSVAARGGVWAAWHPQLPAFPVGVALAMPASRPATRRSELFRDPPEEREARILFVFAMATNPGRLGAGACLVRAMALWAGGLPHAPSLVAFSPLTGLRAHIMRLCDDAARLQQSLESAGISATPRSMRESLMGLLDADDMPTSLSPSQASLLASEAGAFARDQLYRAGRFHRSLGAKLIGVLPSADAMDCESLWFRCLFEYGNVPAPSTHSE